MNGRPDLFLDRRVIGGDGAVIGGDPAVEDGVHFLVETGWTETDAGFHPVLWAYTPGEPRDEHVIDAVYATSAEASDAARALAGEVVALLYPGAADPGLN